MKEKNLDQQFTQNINPIMMCINNTNNARFGGDWYGVKRETAKVRAYLDVLDGVAEQMLELEGVKTI